MTREEKGQIIEELGEKFENNKHFYVTDASGFSVSEINSFRRICFEKGVEYKVYKNTLLKKALEKREGNYDDIFNLLNGFTGIIFSKESGNAPAKVISQYRLKNPKKPIFKGAFVESDFYIGEEKFEALTNLKSKNELIGDIVSILLSPAKNVLSALLSGKQTLTGLLTTLEKRTK